MFNTASTIKQVSSVIDELGTSVTVSRAGQTLFKTNAAFTTDRRYVDNVSSGGRMGTLIVSQVVCYISGSVKTAPQPNDIVIGKNRSYNIAEVDVICPANTPIAYKLVVN